jgi:hypothetical protein
MEKNNWSTLSHMENNKNNYEFFFLDFICEVMVNLKTLSKLLILDENGKNPYTPTPTPVRGGVKEAQVQCLGYFIVGLFCYSISFLLFVWSCFFTYALLSIVYVSYVEDRFFHTPHL